MFSFAKLIFRVTLAGTSDRYLLFSFRRIFRDEFMRTCNERGEQLVYEQLFGQALSPDPAAVRRFQKPPLPFVFDFPVLASPHAPANDVEIALMLAGSAVNSLSLFVASVQRTLARCESIVQTQIILRQILSCGVNGDVANLLDPDGRLVYDGVALLSPDSFPNPVLADGHSDAAVVLLTPLRLLSDGRPVRQLTFGDFVRPLMRRYSSLAYYYCGFEPNIDYKWLARESGDVQVGSSSLQWEEWPGMQGGLTGEVRFSAVPADLFPFLQFGEYFHLGKGAVYGMGRYLLRQ
ncbi:MAG: CRISPR system precrRNA processing endoribonuclease RAMP protein Cas6 [Geobacter sp.]|nr:CRISPR system precrRNA processing endoribonuclease RAMP protein Cas6 [Geobacter sp.]